MGANADTGLRIRILVVPSFNLAATVGFIDPFRAANYLDGVPHFAWEIVSEHGGPCPASNGASLETAALDDAHGEADIVVASASWTPERHATPRLTTALRDAARGATVIGALDTGAFVLAEAGLLSGRRATTHYEHIDALQELYPDVEVVEDLFVFDGNRATCCGGVASVDFALHILKGVRGGALANAAARYVFHPGLREHGAHQQPDGGEPLGHLVPSKVKAAIRMMEEHLEDPVAIPAICSAVGISHRQLNRLFATYIRKTPALYYRDIRLDRARGLVTQTELSMQEIAVASGFASQVHFSRAYRDRFGLPPIKDRIEGRVPFEYRAWPMHRRSRRRV
ncbi:MAG: GlxA family transcriptional regulator [Pseudomonadota bacterium]